MTVHLPPARFAIFNAGNPEDRMKAIAREMRGMQDAADADGRPLTASGCETMQSLGNEFDGIYLATMPGVGRGRKTDPDDVVGGSRRTIPAGPRSRDGGIRSTLLPPGPQGRRVADMFGSAARSEADAMPPADFLRCVGNAHFDPRLIRAEGQNEGEGAAGGYLVPMQLMSAILDGSLESELVRPLARVFAMTSNQLTIAAPNTWDRTSNVAGVNSQWVGEADTINVSTARITPTILRANKLASILRLSNEVIYDAIGGAGMFSDLMRAELSFSLDAAFINGTGAGMPKGILQAESRVVVGEESGQAADTIYYANLCNMWARLAPSAQRNAVWVCSSSALPQLFQMRFAEGSDTPIPVFLPASAGVTAAPGAAIFGRPLYVSEHARPLGDEGDIFCFDPMAYGIGLRLGATLDRSSHALFSSDETLWRLIIRVTGQPLWPSAITPANGGASLSWCVTLGERAG